MDKRTDQLAVEASNTNPQQPLQRALSVRPAIMQDVELIITFLNRQVLDGGKLLPRSKTEIIQSLQEFIVVLDDQTIIGCAGLQIYTADLGEIRTLIVDDQFQGSGAGRLLVEHLIMRAQNIGLKRLMALTYVPIFFHKIGFDTVEREQLPEKVWKVCIKCPKFFNCDEIAVLRYL